MRVGVCVAAVPAVGLWHSCLFLSTVSCEARYRAPTEHRWRSSCSLVLAELHLNPLG